MVVLLLTGIVAVGCSQDGKTAAEKRSEKLIEQQAKEVGQLADKRQRREQDLAAMNVSQLAGELRNESAEASRQGTEPFNSLAFKEIVRRGEGAAAELSKALTTADRSSTLGLLALRNISPNVYSQLAPDFRAAVLVDALRNSQYFNTWGLPHLYWEDGANAIIAEGRAAVKQLTPLLDDARPAPSWGTDEVVEYNAYRYRVRDYAWALLRAILGDKGDIPTDPSERDRLITDLRRRLPG